MPTSGIRRKIDDLGRVVIPVGVRRTLGISEGDRLEVTVDGDRIILAKPVDACVLCGRQDQLVTVHERNVCAICVDDLVAARDGDVTPQVVVLGEPVAPRSTNAW